MYEKGYFVSLIDYYYLNSLFLKFMCMQLNISDRDKCSDTDKKTAIDKKIDHLKKIELIYHGNDFLTK